MSKSSNFLTSCVVYDSPYGSPSRGMEYSTSDSKRASTMPPQGNLFTNFEEVRLLYLQVVYLFQYYLPIVHSYASDNFPDLLCKLLAECCNTEDVERNIQSLTDEERVYLNAAALGDLGIVRQSLEEKSSTLNVNCVDYMGRNSLHLAIDSEKLDVIDILLDNLQFAQIEEALLHAISKGAVKVVKNVIEHPNFMAGEEKLKRMGGDAFFRTEEKSQFSPDITPMLLAAHYNNHEIVQMFLSRNHKIEKPHPISCNCNGCSTKQNYDSLKRSRSRLNAYRALASPAYMALSSPDPIMTTFELRQEMMKLAEVEKEFKKEYLNLVVQCMNFACELMDLCRGTQEVEAVLTEGFGEHSPTHFQRDPLARLKMAIRYEEKKFVAHPNCQQHMTTVWFGSEMAFMQSLNWYRQLIFALFFLPVIPFLCVAFIIFPNTKLGSIMRCPVTKFITHTSSHICFLVLLAVATFRVSENGVAITNTAELNETRFYHLSREERVDSLLKETLRPASRLLTHVQICIVFWILGLLWIECKQIYNAGARPYLTDYYNFMDFGVLSMYLASYVLRFITDFLVSEADRYFDAGTAKAKGYLMNGNHTQFNLFLEEIKDPKNNRKNYFMEASRFHWKSDDPEIVSDVLFAIANVISFARTTYLMPAFEVLGPLQISLGRMIGDITRFMVLFTLVLFAFMVGLHNLYWYYGAQRIKTNISGHTVYVHAAEAFQGLQQTFYSLFWSMFGQVSINDINVKHPGPDGGIVSYPRKITKGSSSYVYSEGMSSSMMGDSSTAIVEGVGMYLFGIYHVVIIIVLINMLIAMMSHSFEAIQGDCDVEWKFARTKLWMNYMDEGSTLPVPFNMVPTPKSLFYFLKFWKDLLTNRGISRARYETSRRQAFIKKRREAVCKNLDIKPDEHSYADIMQRLVKRYLFKLERAKDEKEAGKDGHGKIRAEEVEILDLQDDSPPPPIPETPSGLIPYATPCNSPESREEDVNSKFNRNRASQHRRKTQRSTTRRASNANIPLATTLAIPQLDAIQRQQKLLDVRLQHLQANSKDSNRMIDDVEFIRRLLTENQKAMFNIIQALANIQSEIVNLVKCLKPPTPSSCTAQPLTSPPAVANTEQRSRPSIRRKRQSYEEEESKM